MNSARLLRIVEDWLSAAHFSGQKNNINLQLAEQNNFHRNKAGVPRYRIGVVNGRYTIMLSNTINEMNIPVIADAITDDTEVVVELGCGWGRNVFAIRDLVAHKRPKLAFMGAELSPTGLETARLVAGLDQHSRPAFYDFNYLDAGFGFLSGYKNILIFTVHSIEQVRHIGEDFFKRLLATAEKVRGIHFEPVGWQLNPKIVESVQSAGPDAGAPQPGKIAMFGPVDDAFSAWMPLNSGWNIDLVSCLGRLAQQGVLAIDQVDANCGGDTFYNPTTMISWTKI